jgi:hypothetical protein
MSELIVPPTLAAVFRAFTHRVLTATEPDKGSSARRSAPKRPEEPCV